LGTTRAGEQPSSGAAPFALRPATRHWLLGLARATVGVAAGAYRDGCLDELQARLGAYAPPNGATSVAAEPGTPGVGRLDPQVAAELESPAAAFVTLTVDRELRGCMGRLDTERPLWENVRDAAIAAAIGDPRFPPLEPEEVSGVRIEVSVLGPLIEIAAPAAFTAARHGIVVEADGRRALLLPKVAKEQGWDEATTLAAVCRKAGLPPDAWRWPEARIWVFEAEDFGEAEWLAWDGGTVVAAHGTPAAHATPASHGTSASPGPPASPGSPASPGCRTSPGPHTSPGAAS